MARWKRSLIGAGVGALPGVLVVAIVTLVELVWSPQEILLEVAVLGFVIAIAGLIIGAVLGATWPRRKRTQD